MTWSSAQALIYSARSAPFGALRYVDLATEQEHFVAKDTNRYIGQPRMSPDGRTVAAVWQRSWTGESEIWMVSLVDSSKKKLWQDKSILVPIRWAQGGQSLYVWQWTGTTSKVLRIPVRGSVVSTIAELPVGWVCVDVDITPDGRQVVCTKVENRNDAWMVEHFDPEAEEDL